MLLKVTWLELCLDNRHTTLSNPTGFDPALVAGGQDGAVSRHIYGHAGATLILIGVSRINNVIDYNQRFDDGRTVAESQAEMAGNMAGRRVASAMRSARRDATQRWRKANKDKQCVNSNITENELQKKLEGILCRP